MFDLGDLVPLSVTVRDADGVPTDPAVTSCTVTLPDGTVAVQTVFNPAVGVRTVDFVTTQAGRHLVRWVSTNPNTSFTDVFNVYPAANAALIGLAEAKRHLQMSTTITASDEELRRCIQSATGVVERHLDQVLARRSFTETANMGFCGVRDVLLDRHPVVSLTSIASETVTYDVADFSIIDAATGVIRRIAGPNLYGDVTFTYVAGRAVIPDNVLEATAIIAAHLWETQRQPTLGPRNRFNPADADIMTPGGRGFAIPQRAIELMGARAPMT